MEEVEEGEQVGEAEDLPGRVAKEVAAGCALVRISQSQLLERREGNRRILVLRHRKLLRFLLLKEEVRFSVVLETMDFTVVGADLVVVVGEEGEAGVVQDEDAAILLQPRRTLGGESQQAMA